MKLQFKTTILISIFVLCLTGGTFLIFYSEFFRSNTSPSFSDRTVSSERHNSNEDGSPVVPLVTPESSNGSAHPGSARPLGDMRSNGETILSVFSTVTDDGIVCRVDDNVVKLEHEVESHDLDSSLGLVDYGVVLKFNVQNSCHKPVRFLLEVTARDWRNEIGPSKRIWLPEQGTLRPGSNSFQLNNVVPYEPEVARYEGRIVAVKETN